MNGLVYHIVSGQSFFSGALLVLAAILTSFRPSKIRNRLTTLSLILGVVAIAVSSTPIPYWIYAALVTALAFWLISIRDNRWQVYGASILAGLTLAALIWEISYFVEPHVRHLNSRSATIIGDSVTAGVDGDETAQTWPNLLAQQHSFDVQDISHVGETAGSALRRVQSQGIRHDLVIIEIGGNDLLGSTSATKFAQDLDALLAKISKSERQVLMFELPLPPFCHEYGRIQRSLASKHHVKLIPKRIFLSVIAGQSSTLDSIHLTQAGHQKMCDSVWSILAGALP